MKTHGWWSLTVLVFVGCAGGGDWVDAPQPCASAQAMLSLSGFKPKMAGTPQEEAKRTYDLKEMIEEAAAADRKNGESEQSIKEGMEAFENIIAQGARGVCGNVGKSYTGEWECSKVQQRVKCK